MEPSNDRERDDREKELHLFCATRGRAEKKNIITQSARKGGNVLFMP
jgi:hypothetical protein